MSRSVPEVGTLLNSTLVATRIGSKPGLVAHSAECASLRPSSLHARRAVVSLSGNQKSAYALFLVPEVGLEPTQGLPTRF